MENKGKQKNKLKKRQIFLIVALCIICFGMGALIPYTFQKLNVSSSNTEKEKFESIYSLLVNDWYFSSEVDDIETNLMEKAIEGMVDLEEDPHTNYFDLEQAKLYSSSLAGSNVGVGFSYYLNHDNNLVVKQVFIDSPAEKAGLQYGDEITKVGNLVCSEEDTDTVVSYIKDHESKKINVTYIRDGEEKQIKITPASYDQTVICELNENYAYIVLSSFSEDTGKDFATAMGRVQKAGIKNIILDLRNNTGGYLTAAVDVASSLVKEGSVVLYDETKDGKKTEYTTNTEYSQVDLDHIVVLQNGSTASASEALIGALKDLEGKKLTTVGTNTYGKGTEQTSIAFSDGTSMKYTIAKWYTPKGTNIAGKGFAPDIELESDSVASVEYVEMEEDDVINPDSVNVNATAIQKYLQYLGYEVDRTDEYFSVLSSESLSQFQSDHDLEATGSCDLTTWDALQNEVLIRIGENGEAGDNQLQSAISYLNEP